MAWPQEQYFSVRCYLRGLGVHGMEGGVWASGDKVEGNDWQGQGGEHEGRKDMVEVCAKIKRTRGKIECADVHTWQEQHLTLFFVCTMLPIGILMLTKFELVSLAPQATLMTMIGVVV